MSGVTLSDVLVGQIYMLLTGRVTQKEPAVTHVSYDIIPDKSLPSHRLFFISSVFTGG